MIRTNPRTRSRLIGSSAKEGEEEFRFGVGGGDGGESAEEGEEGWFWVGDDVGEGGGGDGFGFETFV